MRSLVRVAFWWVSFWLLSSAALPQTTPAPPSLLSLCDLARDPRAYDHKPVVVLGRISKRGNERSITLDSCDPPGDPLPQSLAIRFDAAHGPLPPANFSLNADDVRRRFTELSRRTAIHEFPFGSGSYDHWGIVYGRLELPASGAGSAQLLCRGESLIFLWSGR